MKILEIITNLKGAGAQKFVVDLTNEFCAQSHKCTLLTLFKSDSDDILRTFIDNKVHTASLNKNLGFDVKCLLQLFIFIRNEKPDVVHAHIGSVPYLILSALFYRQCKYFATIHSDAEFDAGKGLHRIIRKFLFKYKLVTPITISEESERSFKEFYGMSGNLIPNGCSKYIESEQIDEKKYRKDTDYLFVHVGRLNSVKNQICLVKAFDRILKEGVKARLIIVGKTQEEAVFKLISPYFSDNIIYLGEHPNPRAFINISDAFCMTSLCEGMPISIIEAFSVGCPAIVTPVGGCANMVLDGINGILADDTSEDSFYHAIRRYIELDNNVKTQMAKNALDSYMNLYSINKTVSEYMKLFNNRF